MRVTAAQFEILARQYVNAQFIGASQYRSIEERVYMSYFRLCPLGVAQLWYALEEICSGCYYNDGIHPPLGFRAMRPEHLLLALHFLKTYSGVSTAAKLFGVSEKTHRRYFWAMVHYLSHLGKCTVSLHVTFLHEKEKKTYLFLDLVLQQEHVQQRLRV